MSVISPTPTTLPEAGKSGDLYRRFFLQRRGGLTEEQASRAGLGQDTPFLPRRRAERELPVTALAGAKHPPHSRPRSHKPPWKEDSEILKPCCRWESKFPFLFCFLSKIKTNSNFDGKATWHRDHFLPPAPTVGDTVAGDSLAYACCPHVTNTCLLVAVL